MTFFADERAALLAVAETAGAAVSPVITDIAIGLPFPRGRCIRVSWAGEIMPAPSMGPAAMSIAGSEVVGHRFLISGYWPISDFAEAAAANRQAEMFDFADAVRDAIVSDRTLGGKVTGAFAEPADVSFPTIANQLYGVVDCPVQTAYVEYGA